MWEFIRNALTKYSGRTALGFLSSTAILTAIVVTAPITGLAVTVLTAVTVATAVVGGVAAGAYLVSDNNPESGGGRLELPVVPVNPEPAKPTIDERYATLTRVYDALEARQNTLEARQNTTDKTVTAHMTLSATEALATNRKFGDLRHDTDANTAALKRLGMFASESSVLPSVDAANDEHAPVRGVRRRNP